MFKNKKIIKLGEKIKVLFVYVFVNKSTYMIKDKN